MTVLLVLTLAAFAYSAQRRWRLMMVARRPENRADRIGQRIGTVIKYVFGQLRMPRYPLAGGAHIIVFFGFCVLLLNSIMLWTRGYVSPGSAAYDLWLFGLHQPLGMIYAFLRDIFTVLVILGVLVFFYYRLIAQLPRLTLNFEGVLILLIIFTMMVADLVYEGAEIGRHHGGHFQAAMPFGSLAARVVGDDTFLWHLGFWAHSALVLLFLNLLPYGKHFHVLTVIPNIFTRNLTPRGRLAPIQDIEGRLEREETLGVKAVRDFSWKDVLDLYTCTECGRCSEHCPATSTGKLLSPKHLTTALRDYMYHNQDLLLAHHARVTAGMPPGEGNPAGGDEKLLLVPETIKPEVLWACTTCSACEEECPVFISYIDKIVSLRQNLAMEQGSFPEQLATMFQGLENAGNPYSYPNDQRAEWAAGLDIPLMADRPDVEYLYWVGCAASFDDRSRKIAKALAQLLKTAGVRFAILGPEETCNGDPARRAGNEFLFQMLARQNVETLNRYHVKKIVTACPHCYHTLKHEYPDFGGHYAVVHHSELLARLLREGRLPPQRPVPVKIAFHDACYLGRHNGIYDAPREVLRAIPGVELVEPARTRDRGMCCGAGGAQMWKEEEEGRERVNHARTKQLLGVLPAADSGAALGSACPFCKTMLTDGLADLNHEQVGQLDIAEALWKSVQARDGETPDPTGLTRSAP
jgi:Fe-S oxidoreductase